MEYEYCYLDNGLHVFRTAILMFVSYRAHLPGKSAGVEDERARSSVT